MTIDILSDLHLDFYFKPHLTTGENVASFFRPILTDNDTKKIGDVLIIAGDIGHYNEQNIEVLKIFLKEFYKHIICVLGNHDYYLVDGEAKYTFENDSFKRVEDMRKLINQEKSMYCLDGEVIEIEGIRFGGADSTRHSFITAMLNSGKFKILDISAIVGHTSPQMIMSNYAGFIKDEHLKIDTNISLFGHSLDIAEKNDDLKKT